MTNDERVESSSELETDAFFWFWSPAIALDHLQTSSKAWRAVISSRGDDKRPISRRELERIVGALPQAEQQNVWDYLFQWKRSEQEDEILYSLGREPQFLISPHAVILSQLQPTAQTQIRSYAYGEERAFIPLALLSELNFMLGGFRHSVSLESISGEPSPAVRSFAAEQTEPDTIYNGSERIIETNSYGNSLLSLLQTIDGGFHKLHLGTSLMMELHSSSMAFREKCNISDQISPAIFDAKMIPQQSTGYNGSLDSRAGQGVSDQKLAALYQTSHYNSLVQRLQADLNTKTANGLVLATYSLYGEPGLWVRYLDWQDKDGTRKFSCIEAPVCSPENLIDMTMGEWVRVLRKSIYRATLGLGMNPFAALSEINSDGELARLFFGSD